MTKSAAVHIELRQALNDRVAEIAAALDRPASWVIEQAVEAFVDLDEWRSAAIDEGLRAADEGRVACHEDVVAWVRSWDQPGELDPPKCD